MMNQWVKVGAAVASAAAIGLQTAYPHAAWTIPVTAAVMAALGALHLVPASPPGTAMVRLVPAPRPATAAAPPSNG